jgi:hypothetical protein
MDPLLELIRPSASLADWRTVTASINCKLPVRRHRRRTSRRHGTSAIRSSPKNYPRPAPPLTHGVSFPLTIIRPMPAAFTFSGGKNFDLRTVDKVGHKDGLTIAANTSSDGRHRRLTAETMPAAHLSCWHARLLLLDHPDYLRLCNDPAESAQVKPLT